MAKIHRPSPSFLEATTPTQPVEPSLPRRMTGVRRVSHDQLVHDSFPADPLPATSGRAPAAIAVGADAKPLKPSTAEDVFPEIVNPRNVRLVHAMQDESAADDRFDESFLDDLLPELPEDDEPSSDAEPVLPTEDEDDFLGGFSEPDPRDFNSDFPVDDLPDPSAAPDMPIPGAGGEDLEQILQDPSTELNTPPGERSLDQTPASGAGAAPGQRNNTSPRGNAEIESTFPYEPDSSDSGAGDEPISAIPSYGDVRDYNGRDCPAEVQSLQAAWNELRRTRITEITLDITPALRPNEDWEVDQESRQRLGASIPPREWTSRDGRVVARGRMVDFENGKISVQDESGKVVKLSWYEISNADLCFVSSWWELPSEFSPKVPDYQVRDWTTTTFTWTASALCHKPLYFEEVQLERYGHSAGPVKQVALSGAHFFGSILFLPYQMGLNPPNECQYALGYYRPGSCAPWMLPAVPLHSRAARMQLGAVVGGLLLIP